MTQNRESGGEGAVPAPDPAARLCLRAGFLLLAVSLPLGLTLETLHALKLPQYLRSTLRHELWRLAHAHGSMLGILCLCYAALVRQLVGAPGRKLGVARWLVAGSIAMPAGFFLGGVLNSEGDPSLFILIVPAGALCLLLALWRSAGFAAGNGA